MRPADDGPLPADDPPLPPPLPRLRRQSGSGEHCATFITHCPMMDCYKKLILKFCNSHSLSAQTIQFWHYWRLRTALLQCVQCTPGINGMDTQNLEFIFFAKRVESSYVVTATYV